MQLDVPSREEPNLGKRTTLGSRGQQEILEGVFVTEERPNDHRCKELAEQLKMYPQEVQVRALHPPPRPQRKFSLYSLFPLLAKRHGS